MSIKNIIAQGFEKLTALPVIGSFFEPKPKVAVLRLSGVIADAR